MVPHVRQGQNRPVDEQILVRVDSPELVAINEHADTQDLLLFQRKRRNPPQAKLLDGIGRLPSSPQVIHAVAQLRRRLAWHQMHAHRRQVLNTKHPQAQKQEGVLRLEKVDAVLGLPHHDDLRQHRLLEPAVRQQRRHHALHGSRKPEGQDLDWNPV
ncbi:hypothetical protein GGI06_002198 [Coemansia sp. S85]|nr:hypothetical protein GGI06_002198 [Coemansia sp. S85]